MVRDDLEACLQAYQFAELLLGGFRQKNEKEREHALDAATKLRDDVEERFAAITAPGSVDARAHAVKAARARLELKLNDARGIQG
jgi:hypothetical protein